MDERRAHNRETTEHGGSIALAGRTFPCRIRNLSPGGALVEIESPHCASFSVNDVGQEIEITMPEGPDGGKGRQGRIIRLTGGGESVFMALFFL